MAWIFQLFQESVQTQGGFFGFMIGCSYLTTDFCKNQTVMQSGFFFRFFLARLLGNMAGGKNRQFLGSLLEKKFFLVPMGSIKGMAIFG